MISVSNELYFYVFIKRKNIGILVGTEVHPANVLVRIKE